MTKTVDEIMEQVNAILMAYMDDGTSVTECLSLKAKLRTMVEDAVRVPDGWRLVPIEPDNKQLDAGVAMALNVQVSAQYGWSKYIRALYMHIVANAPEYEAKP